MSKLTNYHHKNICNVCGTQFKAIRSDKLYCSRACQMIAYRKRKDNIDIGNIDKVVKQVEKDIKKLNEIVKAIPKKYKRVHTVGMFFRNVEVD